ncbi:MAG: hypothetical protein ACP5XB_13980, partial [Isosphaeraceae bacterium]
MNRIARLLAGLGAVLLLQGMATRSVAQTAPSPAEGGRPAAMTVGDCLPDEFIILNGPADFSAFLKKLNEPDWIFVRPAGRGSAGGGASVVPATNAPKPYFVNSVKIRGRLDDNLADLTIEMELGLVTQGTSWVPLEIENPIVTSAREGERELELRSTGADHWDVRLEGPGTHRLLLALRRPVRISPDRKHLELAIPLAASTSLELEAPRAIRDVDLGTGESVGTTVLSGGKGTRLTADVSPRSRLTLDWTDEANSETSTAPVFTASVEMFIDADAESITTQSSWVIRCVRGAARRFEFLLDQTDVVPRVKLEDQYISANIERNVLRIPLGEPLRPGETRHLFMETRRTFPPGSTKFSTFSGYPLLNAAEQTGAVGIHKADNLWVNVSTTQGLRRIDPLNLPSGLRTQPGISHAFLFLDQPFKLGLGIESSPPLFQTETSTRLDLDDELARVAASIVVHQVRGRLFDLDVAVPPGMQLLAIGPPDLVDSSTAVSGPDQTAKGASPSGPGRIHRLHLTEVGRDQRTFTLRLRGQERIGSKGELTLGLFSVPGGVAASSTVSVFADPTVSFELIDEPDQPGGPGASGFRVQPPSARSASATPAETERFPLLVLKSHQNPVHLRGRLTRHARVVTHDTRITAQVSARQIEVRQETSLQVRHGSIRSLVVRVPLARPDLWQVQGKETIRRSELESQDREGRIRRYRLSFEPPITDQSLLTFVFPLPLAALREGGKSRSTISWVQLEEGSCRSTAVELATSPGIKVSSSGSAWVQTDESPSRQTGAARVYRLVQPEAANAGFPLEVQLLERVALPPLVAPRALLRTDLGPENETRTHAWYWIETHPPQLSITLPEGAQWIRSRLDGRVTEQVDRDPVGTGFLLNLPAESQSKPLLVEIEYQVKGEQSGRILPPPELPEGAVVLQSLWEVHVPWSRAILGVPDGWADENQWYWDFYVWKRRPWSTFARLLAWVSGPGSSQASPEDVEVQDQDDSHSYLFGRSGRPVLMRPWVVSRALVVAICSGSVLLLGFYLMFFRTRLRLVWAGLAVLGLLAAVFAHPSVLVLVVQSAVSGLVLALLGLLIQNLIERARARHAAASPPPAAGPGSGSALSPPGVGSDDSTAIRPRVSSTMDYAAPLSIPADPEAVRSSR